MPDALRRLLPVAALVGIGLTAWLLLGRGEAPQPAAPGPTSGGAPVAVVTAAVVEKPLAVRVEALGTARANEAIEVTSRAARVVTTLRFIEGQQVRRDQVLVELESAQDRAELAAAEAALAESRSAFTRSRDLFTQQALSQAQLEQIEATLKANEARVAAAAARVADTVIRAPFAGTVGLRRVSIGALVSPGTVITTLDDTATMKLDFDVPEVFLAVMQAGLAIESSSAAWPGASFAGTVETVDSRVDPVTRTVRVRARLPNPDGRLRPGMFLTVRVSREPQPGLVVPEQAVIPERGSMYVFVVADGKVERREVQLGRRNPGEVEVIEGLAAGERVIVEGTQKVRPGVAVTEFQPTAAR
ncbi:MAG: efflux RND transporter periplasmic adaptor subunit [Gammaproteobacteria bacterium]|nr:efflux RND transporter periplasmic adaptor subunit [Gammaproteobacteria bacterium]